MDTEDGVTSDTGGSFTNESVATITVGVVDEQREREKRKLNLVVHNVPESTKQSGPEKKLMISVKLISCYMTTFVLIQPFLMPSV